MSDKTTERIVKTIEVLEKIDKGPFRVWQILLFLGWVIMMWWALKNYPEIGRY